MVRRQLAGTYLGLDYHRQALEDYGFGEEVAAATKAQAAGDVEGVIRAVSDRMVNAITIIGTADECLERVAENTALTDWVSPRTTNYRFASLRGDDRSTSHYPYVRKGQPGVTSASD